MPEAQRLQTSKQEDGNVWGRLLAFIRGLWIKRQRLRARGGDKDSFCWITLASSGLSGIFYITESITLQNSAGWYIAAVEQHLVDGIAERLSVGAV